MALFSRINGDRFGSLVYERFLVATLHIFVVPMRCSLRDKMSRSIAPTIGNGGKTTSGHVNPKYHKYFTRNEVLLMTESVISVTALPELFTRWL